MHVDRGAPLRFLRTAFLPNDWIAVLLKRHDTGEAVQRVGPVELVLHPRFQGWLRYKNAQRFNVFVSINALTPGRRSRTRESVFAVRHVFLDADRDAEEVLSAIERRSDLPKPTVVVRSSRGRAHVLWRVEGASVDRAEALQKQLARELDTDDAATSAAQMTRLPGFFNHKYTPPGLVLVDFTRVSAAIPIETFPLVPSPSRPVTCEKQQNGDRMPMLERARRYLAAVPPAVQGQSGDATTFRVCCRLVERFGLTDTAALVAMQDWNSRCQPPWRTSQLAAKLASARRRVQSV